MNTITVRTKTEDNKRYREEGGGRRRMIFIRIG